MNLGVSEAILTEKLEHGLRHPDGRDLLVELDWGRRGRADVEATPTGGQCPNRLGPATYRGHPPASEYSSRCPPGGRPCLEMLARSARLRHRSMGLSPPLSLF
jgi:hypothetical protein